MAVITCANCNEETSNIEGGIYVVKKTDGSNSEQMVCGECAEEMELTGKWKIFAQAKKP